MKLFLAILLGKAILFFTKTFGIGGGSAAPGLYALKIEPQLIEKLIKQIPQNIIITGTNGKTTTSKMLAHFANANGLKVVRNSTGSNLERGIASTLVQNTSLSLHLKGVSLGIWEIDEAAFNKLLPKIKPNQIVFLNAFRDQLDRYGEVDSVVKKWCESIKHVNKNTSILINGDDANTLKIKDYFTGQLITFGVKGKQIGGEGRSVSGNTINIQAASIAPSNLDSMAFDLNGNNSSLKVNLPLPGIYNIYNFLAAYGLAVNLGIPKKIIINSLQNFEPAFGRVEKFSLQPRRLQRKNEGFIFLIKNPTGATQVFETVKPILKPNDKLLFALNDNLADGRDVSWIWDAEFERFMIHDSRFMIQCSGTRAYDMANRLKYAGIEVKSITVEPDLKKAFKVALTGLNGCLYVFPTYTAMLELQKVLVELGIKKHYWRKD